MILYALETGTKNLKYIFADTDNEDQAVYDYLDYLRGALNIEIQTVKADFSKRMANKAEYIKLHWADDGVPDDMIESALKVLSEPTGNAFLDMCLWKGRFPSRKAQFCSQELKGIPIRDQVIYPLQREGHRIRSWQGIRAQESAQRAKKIMHELDDLNVWIYRPLLNWSADEVFEIHRKHGIKWNPLYEKGMGRVGCMPCINCRKGELENIAKRFPDHIYRIREWEHLVSQASKSGSGTFFPVVMSGERGQESVRNMHLTQGIDAAVEWSKTTRGGKQYDLLLATEPIPKCASMYGLCDMEDSDK